MEVSTRKSVRQRKITELLDRLQQGDVVIVSELSRLSRSIKEVLATVETLVEQKKSRLVLVKQNLDADSSNRAPDRQKNLANKILITVFSMMAGPPWPSWGEILFPSALRTPSRRAKGIKLGKPKGTIQASIGRNNILQAIKYGYQGGYHT